MTMLNCRRTWVAPCLRIVLAEVSAAAFLALDRRSRDRLGDRSAGSRRSDRRVPAGVVLAVAVDHRLRRRGALQSPASARLPRSISSSGRTMPTSCLHHVLQVVLHLNGFFARSIRGRTALSALRALPGPAASSTRAGAVLLRELARRTRRRACRSTSRSDSELPPSRFAPCMPAAHSPAAKRPGTVDICVSRVDADAAHDVVRRRPDLHRLVRDVELGELLELVIHARAACFLMWSSAFGSFVFDPRDVEEHAAVRTNRGRP